MKAQTLTLVGQEQLGNRCLFSWNRLYPILFLTLGVVLKVASCTECGHPSISQRVVGGESTSPGKTPWMGSLVYNGNHVCGVSVISRTCLATAAHCLNGKDPTKLSVVLGTVNLTSQTRVTDSVTRVEIDVKNVTLYPNYNDKNYAGDLAMLELKKPINFTSNILPICLPGPNQNFPDGMMCSLTGWGSISEGVSLPSPYTLQEVKLPLINAETCDQMFLAKYGNMYTPGTIRSDNICAGYANQRKDGCQGDSGGPLACQVGDTWFLVGIVSWGVGCATPGIPGVYTKVSNFTTWMVEHCELNDIFTKKINTTTVKTATFSTAKFSTDKFSTAKCSTQLPKQAAQGLSVIQQTTAANGANLGSSIPISLLIISSIITKIQDIL